MIDKSLVWSAKHGPCPAGDQALHHYVGELLYKEGSFEAAEPHFLASGSRDSARLLAEMFIQWATPTSTFGPFALRGTIPYLQNGNILAARTFIKHFVSAPAIPRSTSSSSSTIPIGTSSDEIIIAQDPIINFAQLAVATCQRAQGDRNKVMRESWVRLCGTYQSRGGPLTQPEVRRALQEIATLYFAIPPPRNQAENPIADMMSSVWWSNLWTTNQATFSSCYRSNWVESKADWLRYTEEFPCSRRVYSNNVHSTAFHPVLNKVESSSFDAIFRQGFETLECNSHRSFN